MSILMSILYETPRPAAGRCLRAAVWGAALGAVTVLAAPSAPALGQAGPSTFDRTLPPDPMPPRLLNIPAWAESTLSNGARLIVSEKHDLPLVYLTINLLGGANQDEPADKTGLAGIAAAMLSEGTASMTGDQLSDAIELLGTSVNVRVSDESGNLTFLSTTENFPVVLEIVADMIEHPSFPADALERLRARTLVGLTQAKDRPAAIAANVFARVLYGEDHPYGRFMTERSVESITREDVVAFHEPYFRPGRAIITLVGDVDAATATSTVDAALSAWSAGGEPPSYDYPAVPALRPTTIYLVDKPGAAQSVFAIGHPGPARDTPDYFAIEVMNTILGGLFQSRLNHDIREVKGYSYGVGSGFGYGKGPGAFRAGGAIVTAKTDSALIAFMTHLRGVQGDVPFTDDEIAQGKAALIQRLPQLFATVNATATAISGLVLQDLPLDYYETLADHVNAVTMDDLVRVARQYIDLDHLEIIIVGDRSVIEAPLAATNIAPIVHLDIEGEPLAAETGAAPRSVRAQALADATLANLAFMAGCWKGDFANGGVLEETYTSPSANLMLGVSRYLRGDTAVQHEFARITADSTGIALLPFPGGRPSEHEFRLTTLEASSATFEAPEHDFPKRIRYTRGLDGSLTARIDAGTDDSRTQEWRMEPVTCHKARS